MEKYLIVVDMQNDFLTGGALPVEGDSSKLVKDINKLQKEFDPYNIYYTIDVHQDDYLDTREGKSLPTPHCIDGTYGVLFNKNLFIHNAINIFSKETFGCLALGEHLKKKMDEQNHPFNIYLCGVATDICVLSNAIIIQNLNPDVNVYVLEDYCLGTTIKNHRKAIDVLKNLGIKTKKGESV